MEKYIKAIVISFPGLLLTFVDDMFDGNMAVLVRISQLWNRNWFAAKCFNRFSQTMDGTFHFPAGPKLSIKNRLT